MLGDAQTYYRSQSRMTDPESRAALYVVLPSIVAELVALVQGLVIDKDLVTLFGLNIDDAQRLGEVDMPRSESWTTDLQTSVDTFANYYPEKTIEMNTALEWAKAGSSDKQKVVEFIDTFGQWLTKEFQEQILIN
jgi:hypothetical protein